MAFQKIFEKLNTFCHSSRRLKMAVEILEINIQEKEAEGVKFYYVDISSSRANFRVWINPNYYKNELEGKLKNRYMIGILRNARIEKTSKGSIVVKKGNNNIFFIRVKCGFRGDSEFKVLSSAVNVIEFGYKHSPNGSLGVSACGLVETAEDHIKLEWKRSGRLYGEPSKGISIIKVDGTIQKLDGIKTEEIKEIIAD
jgi:hypothetical protein